MNKWREDAQPEWPQAASATRHTPEAGGGTRAFPETGRTSPDPGRNETGRHRAAGDGSGTPGAPAEHPTEFLTRAARARLRPPAPGTPGALDADETAVLPQADAGWPRTGAGWPPMGTGLPQAAAADATAVLPRAGFPGAAPADGLPHTGVPGTDATRLLPPSRTPAPPRDPWTEPGAEGMSGTGAISGAAPDTEHTHDPHEVTVQLDAVQLGAGGLRPVAGGPGIAPGGSDGPVFVDESGRRSRTFRRIGILVGLACAVYAVVIVATMLSGNSSAPWLPVPDQRKEQPAGQVDAPLLPTASVDTPAPSGTDTSTGPSGTPTASGEPGDPGTGALPSAPDSTVRPSTSSAPDPSVSTPADPSTGTGTGTSSKPDPATTPPVVASPGPSTPAGGGIPDFSPSPAGGVGTVADGAVDPVVVQPSPTVPPSPTENVA